MSTNKTEVRSNNKPGVNLWFAFGSLVLTFGMLVVDVYGLADPVGFDKKKYEVADYLGLSPESDVLQCKDPGKEVSLEDRNDIIQALIQYSEQPGVSLEWDPKRVICTVDSGGELSFHIEKGQEELVDAAMKASN